MPARIRSAAQLPKIHHLYFCSGSGASIGRPNPPPGRLLESAGAVIEAEFSSFSFGPGAALFWPVSGVPWLEIVNERFWPLLVFAATCTLASGWLGLFINLKPVEPAAAWNCKAFGIITTKFC